MDSRVGQRKHLESLEQLFAPASIQRIMRTFQKDPDMIPKGLPLAKSETEHQNK